METLGNYLKENMIKVVIITVLLFLYVGSFIYISSKIIKTENETKDEINMITKEETEEQSESNNENEIVVDVKGSVMKPGVYKIKENSRVTDAIAASGGLAKNANTRFINLSKILKDGDVVVIYSNEEIEKAKKQETIVVETPCICEEVKNDACYKEDNKNTNGKININTASLTELMTLTGIGESKAKLIIEYRTQNGNFKDIKDIMKVKGISETLYSKFKENITV